MMDLVGVQCHHLIGRCGDCDHVWRNADFGEAGKLIISKALGAHGTSTVR